MFEHLTLFLSFIYVIALTHILSSATDLVLQRDRVRVSYVLIGWMVLAVLLLIINWLSLAGLVTIKHWTVNESLLQFGFAFVQYFTCSLVSIRLERDEEVDMPAFFDRQRPVILGAFAALVVWAMITNFLDRHNNGLGPNDWIAEDLACAIMLPPLAAAYVWRARWVQTVAVLFLLAANLALLVRYEPLG